MNFNLNSSFSQPLLKGWAYGRSLLYLSESLPLILLHWLKSNNSLKPPPEDFKKHVFEEIKALLDKDVENISNGIYPVDVLLPEGNLLQHFDSLRRVVTDALKLSERKRNLAHKEFSDEAKDWSKDLPEYYVRNFHFQTDGYLSEASAELYDHQVELLFRGVSQAMRRLLLPSLRAWASDRPIRILEVACGTGSFTRSLAYTLPQAKITAFDLSFPYLKKAQSRLKKFSRIEFVQGQAEDLPFKPDQFDAVVSVYLFHELPLDVRKKSLLEMQRVLKPGGFLGLVDSLQLNDVPSLNWGLEQFPRDFHEPFYKNYLLNPMEALLKELAIDKVQISQGFLSKALWALKQPPPQEI